MHPILTAGWMVLPSALSLWHVAQRGPSAAYAIAAPVDNEMTNKISTIYIFLIRNFITIAFTSSRAKVKGEAHGGLKEEI